MHHMSEFKRPARPPDLEVDISLLATEAGGRTLPLWQGCRLPHDFGLPDEFNDGMYEFLGNPPAPGESQRAMIWLLAPERNAGRLCEGFEFKAWESRFIAQCKIIRVVNPILSA